MFNNCWGYFSFMPVWWVFMTLVMESNYISMNSSAMFVWRSWEIQQFLLTFFYSPSEWFWNFTVFSLQFSVVGNKYFNFLWFLVFIFLICFFTFIFSLQEVKEFIGGHSICNIVISKKSRHGMLSEQFFSGFS